MVATRLDVAGFTYAVRKIRDENDGFFDTAAEYRQILRDELGRFEHLIRNPAFAAPLVAATAQEWRSMLSCAAQARQQHGATDSQIETLVRLAVRDGMALSQMNVSVLTRGEASAMIAAW